MSEDAASRRYFGGSCCQLFSRKLSFFFVASLLALGACERKPADSTRQAAVVPPRTTPLPASGPVAAPATPADTTAGEEAALMGDVPALHTPFTVVRLVAPGLEVLVAPVPVPATASIREPSELQLTLTIRRNHQVIFQDTTDDGLAYSGYSEPQTARLYPLWLPTGPDAGELLVAYSGRPNRDRVRRFYIKSQRVTRIDTLTAFDGPAKNLDRDARLEYSGYADYGEEWDDAQGHHQTYNPLLCYEARPTGLVLDTALTISRNRALYGKFYGYHYSEKPVIITKQPGKQRK